MNDIDFREEDNVVIITLNPSITQYDFQELCSHITQSYLVRGKNNFIFDCENVSSLPSIAYGTLCSLVREAKSHNGNVSLIHVNETIQDIMKRIHVNRVINVHNNLREAKEEIQLV